MTSTHAFNGDHCGLCGCEWPGSDTPCTPPEMGEEFRVPDGAANETIVRRRFFWSLRTLRCEVWVADDVLGEYLDRHEDCLNVDYQHYCIIAHAPYDELIPELLNKHFACETDA